MINMLQYLSNALIYFNAILIPIYLALRIRNNKSIAFINPCLYLLVASYLYLTIPSIFFEQYFEIMGFLLTTYLNYEKESLLITNIICNWFVLVFFGYYILSIDKGIKIRANYKPKAVTTKIAFFLVIFLSLFFLALIIIYAPQLFSATLEESRRIGELFVNVYRFKILSIALATSVMILVWKTKKVKWYAFLIWIIIIDFLTRSRGRSMFVIIFSYINYVAIFNKIRLPLILFLLVGIVSTFFLRGSVNITSVNDLIKIPLQLLGETFNTRATTIIVYQSFLNNGSLIDYLTHSFINIFPDIIGSNIKDLIWIDSEEVTQAINYQSVIRNYYNDQLGIRWGLAGNIASEALYFGGIPFALVSPLLIGAVFYLFHELNLNRTLPSFIFLNILIAELPRGIMRNTFYDTFFAVFYIMFSYLIWVVLLEGKRVILKLPQKSI